MILQGNCLDKLKELEENSVDSVVTDPPYELGFMGKGWDNTGIANNPDVWRECLRVLKPGGHLLAFSGTRTYHRMAVAIEDAGFEVRDMIEWVYGSGFPKSHNIGKAVDKLQGNEREDLGLGDGRSKYDGADKKQRDNDNRQISTGKDKVKITKGTSEWEGWGTALKPSHETVAVARKPLIYSYLPDNSVRDILHTICQSPSLATTVKKILASNQKESGEDVSIAQWIADENTSTQDALFVLMATLQSELAKEKSMTLNIVSSWLSTLSDLLKHWNTYTTETKTSLIIDLKTLNSLLVHTIQESTIKEKTKANGVSANVLLVDNIFNVLKLKLKTIRELSADETAMSKVNEQGLPPNHEPICMARKPLAEKTVAENCLKWGTGGINIDESRVEYSGKTDPRTFGGKWKTDKAAQNVYEGGYEGTDQIVSNLGRFPANLIHDNSEEVRECFPETHQSGNKVESIERRTAGKSVGSNTNFSNGQLISYKDDSNNASRFFKSILYYPKASKSERNKGCEGLEEKQSVGGDGGIGDYLDDVNSASGKYGSEKAPAKNAHPCVKPIALMEYLIKMVTPKGGTVLDPFMGSGSTGVACKQNNYDFIGIELDPEYIKIAEARIASVSPTLPI